MSRSRNPIAYANLVLAVLALTLLILPVSADVRNGVGAADCPFTGASADARGQAGDGCPFSGRSSADARRPEAAPRAERDGGSGCPFSGERSTEDDARMTEGSGCPFGKGQDPVTPADLEAWRLSVLNQT